MNLSKTLYICLILSYTKPLTSIQPQPTILFQKPDSNSSSRNTNWIKEAWYSMTLDELNYLRIQTWILQPELKYNNIKLKYNGFT